MIWTGVDYELIKVKLGSDEYKKVNPLGAVPALDDGTGTIMTQADSLLKYLVNQYPNKDIYHPVNHVDSQQLDQWLAFFTGDLHPVFWPMFSPQKYTIESEQTKLDSVKQTAFKQLRRLYSVLNNHLAGKEYILGEQLSIIDPYAYVMTRWLALTPISLDDYPNVLAHFNRMKLSAPVITAETEEGIR